MWDEGRCVSHILYVSALNYHANVVSECECTKISR